jgi:hypothetical protein
MSGSARAYPRKTQEMVFDAHDRALAFFKSRCIRQHEEETVFVGKDRLYNRRFRSYYLVGPVASTPGVRVADDVFRTLQSSLDVQCHGSMISGRPGEDYAIIASLHEDRSPRQQLTPRRS